MAPNTRECINLINTEILVLSYIFSMPISLLIQLKVFENYLCITT